jgi:hypothetical protein
MRAVLAARARQKANEISEVARLVFLWLLSKSSQSLNHEVVNQMCLSQPLEPAKPQSS